MALDRQLQIREAEEAREALFLQQSAGIDRVEAIRRWRRRCRATLLRDLQWPADETRRERLVEKCVRELEVIARHLYQRGWLLNEERLGLLVKACLAPIGEAQRSGQIREFWPYFSRSVRAFVGINAEQIQSQARRDGSDVATSMASLVANLGIPGLIKPATASLTEILAERPTQTKATPSGSGLKAS